MEEAREKEELERSFKDFPQNIWNEPMLL